MTTEIVGYTTIGVAVLVALWRAWRPEYTAWLRSKIQQAKPLLNFALPVALLIGGLLLVKTPTCSLPDIINLKPAVYPDAWLVIIEESSQRNPDLAILLQDWNWRQSLAERDINFRIYDKDQKEAASYEKLKLQLPAAVFIEPSGKVIEVVKCPTSKKAMEDLIRKVTGK